MTGIAGAQVDAPREFGWIERVKISPGNIELHAKLDTGADHCSLHAKDLHFFKKGGKRFARFSVRNREGKEVALELPTYRTATIKRVDGDSDRRPVVQLFVCLGEQFMQVDVNLADRSDFAYPMLVGRSFLAGNVVVNPAKTFTSRPTCNFPPEKND